MRHSETANSDIKTAKNFTGVFKKLGNSETYLPQQVFNCDEMGLFRKKMLK